jgi:hypothetical protein
MGRLKGALFGAIIGAAVGFADALFVHAPYGNGEYIPQTDAGVIAAYVSFTLPWALVGAVIGFLVGRRRKAVE